MLVRDRQSLLFGAHDNGYARLEAGTERGEHFGGEEEEMTSRCHGKMEVYFSVPSEEMYALYRSGNALGYERILETPEDPAVSSEAGGSVEA